MSEHWEIYADWNPWHGCTKISPGCKYCYVYRQDEMYGSEISSSECRKTANFNLPIKKKRDKSWKIESGKLVFTCFTSDFLLKDADEWRPECWQMIKQRSDLWFFFFTKRIDRFMECVPDDWGDGYDNVIVGCTVENQEMADYRLPIFLSLPIKHKSIIVAPMLTAIDLTPYLNDTIEEVSVGGESGEHASSRTERCTVYHDASSLVRHTRQTSTTRLANTSFPRPSSLNGRTAIIMIKQHKKSYGRTSPFVFQNCY